MKHWISLGAFLGALTVALGAFGAHALKTRLTPEELAWWNTSVQYHGAHSLALVLFGVFAQRSRVSDFAGWSFTVGIALFCGSLYAMALGAPRWLGAVTPFGGVALIAAWLFFAVAAWRARES
ncbi:MAG: DUF423 domain-containing protein [Planctomycetes bacterium]|nr:DUF423 domain-containing protein [Planctomycetota bacterium]